MKRLILANLFLILHNGVSGFETNGVKSLSVMEGDSLPLYTCLNDTQKYETILWMYESGNALIAKFIENTVSFPDGNERFTDRLEMDFKTGSLTIRNIRTYHSGVYSVEMISTSKPQYLRRFNVTVVDVFDPHADKIIQKLAKEGESVTLRTEMKVQKDVLILWKFAGTKHSIYSKDVTTIGKIDGEAPGELFDYGENEKFKKRLKIERSTGSLTITNIRLEHAGFYTLQIHNNAVTRFRSFNITVRADAHSCLKEFWKPVAIALIVFSVGMVILSLAVVIKKHDVLFSKEKTSNLEKTQVTDVNKPLQSEENPSSNEVLSEVVLS